MLMESAGDGTERHDLAILPYETVDIIVFARTRVRAEGVREWSAALDKSVRALFAGRDVVLRSQVYSAEPSNSLVLFVTKAGIDKWLGEALISEERKRTFAAHALGEFRALVAALPGPPSDAPIPPISHDVWFTDGAAVCYQGVD